MVSLPLISPNSSNFIKDWPAQNAINCDLIDNYAGSYGVQSYTPVFNAVTTSPVLGTGGFVNGFYYQIFDQIFTWGEFRFGTGFSPGSGNFEVTLPFDAHFIANSDTNMGNGPIIGNCRVWNNTTDSSKQPGLVQLRTISQMMFGIRFDTASAVRAMGAGIPFTWAAGDGISWFCKYQRVPQ